MCYACYESYHSPKILNWRVVKAAMLISKIYEHDLAGGRAHLVVDDWNLEDRNIDFCLDANEDYYTDDPDNELNKVTHQALTLLKELTLEERASAMALHDGFLDVGYLFKALKEQAHRLEQLEELQTKLESARDDFYQTAIYEQGGIDVLHFADWENLHDRIEEVLWI